MTNINRTTLYVGVTSNLPQRVLEHKNHLYPTSFTSKYNLEICIFFEYFDTIESAIAREKEIKKWRREKKDTLINTMNEGWIDLGDKIRAMKK